MRLKLLLLCGWFGFALTCMSQSSNEALLQLPVSGEFKNQHVLEVLQSLETSYPVRFFYKEEWISRDKKSYQFEGTPLGEVILELLDGSDLRFIPYNDYSILIGRWIDLMDLEGFSFEDFVSQVSAIGQKPKPRTNKLAVLGDSLIRPLPIEATLTGQIYDYDSDQPLNGAQIVIPELQIGAITDSTGTYTISLPTGNHEAVLSATGRETLTLPIRVFSDADWNVPLAFTAYQLEEVLLQADSKGQSAASPQAGRVQLSIIDIRRAPALLGEPDIINALLNLPGVSTVGDASSGFNVRGGNIDQNLVLQDGNMVLNSSHLLGFYSIFNPDVVKNVTLYKGHIPAQFGGRLSSVLDVDLIEGSYRNPKGRGSIGIISSKFMFNGPIRETQSSYVAAFRGAYPNLITKFIDRNLEIQQSSSYYGDALLKFTQKLGDFGKISLMGYGSRDFFRFADDFGYSWSTYMGGVTWEQIYGDKFSSKLEINGGRYVSDFFNANGPTGASTLTGMDNYHAKANLQFVPNRMHNLNFGLEATRYDGLENKVKRFGEDSSILPRSVQKDQGLEMAAFINDDITFNPLISLSIGLRVSAYLNQGPFKVYSYAEGLERSPFSVVDSTIFEKGRTIQSFQGIEPRASLRIFLDDLTSVKLSYNRLNQYVHLLSNTAAATPVDTWQLSNFYIPPQQGDNYSIGIFRNTNSRQWQFSIEGFYRDLRGLSIAKNFAELLANAQIETEVLNGKGRAYGAEFSINQKSGKWEIDASYTFSRSLRRTGGNVGALEVNGGEWFPADFDSPHNISISGKLRPRSSRTFTVNFIYRSGRPITAPIGSYPLFPAWNVPAFSNRNEFRIPDYHRLDLSYTFDDQLIKRKKYKTEITLSIYNLYASKNAYSVFFENNSGIYRAFKLSILGTLLPMFSYNYRF